MCSPSINNGCHARQPSELLQETSKKATQSEVSYHMPLISIAISEMSTHVGYTDDKSSFLLYLMFVTYSYPVKKKKVLVLPNKENAKNG